MIGASLPASPVGSSVASVPDQASAPSDADTSSRLDGAAAKSDGSPGGTSPARRTGGRAATQADAATQRDARDVGDASPPDFANLLAANGAADAATDAATRSTPTEPAASEPPATTALPEQLLALLVGNWAPTTAPAPSAAAPAGTPPPAGKAALPTLQLPAMPAGSAPSPAASGPATGPAAGAAGEGLAALAKLAADALGATASADRPGASTVEASPRVEGIALATSPVASPARAIAPVPAAVLAMPADPDAGFDDGFGARIAWMAEQRIGHAEIRLNPEHVGPIDVRVQLDGNRVTAEFHSAHVEVRRAIEASMPQLREMLGQQGLQLGHADVGQRNAQGHAPSRGARTEQTGFPDGENGARTSPIAPLRSRGLLDEYA